MTGFSLLGSVLAIGVALGGLGGWKVTTMHFHGVIATAERKAETDRETERIKQAAAAKQYEAYKAVQRPRVITATREVEHALQTDPWAYQPIPRGVLDSLTGAIAATGAGQPDGAVPAVPAAGDRDQWGLGTRIRLGLGLGSGLPTEAPEAR